MSEFFTSIFQEKECPVGWPQAIIHLAHLPIQGESSHKLRLAPLQERVSRLQKQPWLAALEQAPFGILLQGWQTLSALSQLHSKAGFRQSVLLLDCLHAAKTKKEKQSLSIQVQHCTVYYGKYLPIWRCVEVVAASRAFACGDETIPTQFQESISWCHAALVQSMMQVVVYSYQDHYCYFDIIRTWSSRRLEGKAGDSVRHKMAKTRKALKEGSMKNRG